MSNDTRCSQFNVNSDFVFSQGVYFMCVYIIFWVEKGTLKSVIISEKKIFKKSLKYNINSQRVKL